MNTLTHAVEKDYTIVQNQIFRDAALSYRAKGVWCQLLSLPEGWNFSVAGLATLSKEKEKAISAAIGELVEQDYLIWDKKRTKGGRFTAVVTVKLPDIYPDGKKPHGFKPHGESDGNKVLKNKVLTNKLNTTKASEFVSFDKATESKPVETKHSPLNPELSEFIRMRKSNRRPMTEYALDLLQKKLTRLYPDDIPLQKECLAQAIEAGWLTVYALKDVPKKLDPQAIRW